MNPARGSSGVGRRHVRSIGIWLLIAAGWPAATAAQPARPGPAAHTDASGLEVFGQADYDWSVRTLDGAPVDFEAFRGRVLVVNLWASWCTPCVRELGSFERLRASLSDTDIAFLMIAAEDERPVRRFLDRYDYDLPFYLESDRVPAAFPLRGLPTTWVVDARGRIVLVRHGEGIWDTAEVETFLRSLRMQSGPEP